jgi:hypothetical protein
MAAVERMWRDRREIVERLKKWLVRELAIGSQ